MTAILLIADSVRVQTLFADLESRGVLQLHTAATLDQVDQELTAFLPAYTFIQSRISGLSTGILLRHIKKALPEASKIVLLSADDADLQPGLPLAIQLLDLRTADEVLAQTIAGILTGSAPPSPAHGGKAAQQKNGAKKTRQQEKPATRSGSKQEQADAQESQKGARQRAAGANHPQVKAKKPQEVRQARQEPGASALAPPEQVQPQDGSAAVDPPPEKSAPPFEEAIARLAQGADLPVQEVPGPCAGEGMPPAPLEPAPLEPAPAGEPAEGELPAAPTFPEVMAAASARRGPDTFSPPEVQDLVRLRASERAPGDAAIRSGQRSKPLWLFLPLLAFLLIPATAYFAGRAVNPQEQELRQQRDRGTADRGALPAAATPAAALSPRAAAEAAPKGSPAQEASQVSGPAALPPFLEGVERDRGYGDSHPGWERYVGASAEYKLFREDGRYRAIQAIARADEIPDRLFRRVLLEFGGIAGYAVTSTEQKGEYLVEQATGSGSAALTIYRRKDSRLKGFVVYYR